jgi:hypothetical protein
MTPSELFLDSFAATGGAPSVQCVCGRTHYAPDADFTTDAERAAIIGQSQARPDLYVLHEGQDGLTAHEVNGTPVVADCPCAWLARFERLLWNERARILDYFVRRQTADKDALARLDEATAGEST